MDDSTFGEIHFNDRASRMDLSDGILTSERLPGYSEEERIREQMSGVAVQLHEEDPDEMREVQEQLRKDVREEVSEDDYEDESESEELLRRMPWLQYTAPEVLERASNRSYQYKGLKQRAAARAEEEKTNPYEGEAFREAVDELREKIIEAKENADEAAKNRVRDRVYIPPMHEPKRPKEAAVEEVTPQPEQEVAQAQQPELQVQPVQVQQQTPQEQPPVQAQQQPAPQVQQPQPKREVVRTQKPQQPTPAPQEPKAHVPFTASALFREKETAPEDFIEEQPQMPKGFAAVKDEVRSFKAGIIDLDDEEDAAERALERLDSERFEAEEALAEAVIAEEGAEDAFDTADTAAQFAPERLEEEETTRHRGLSKPLTAMERLKAMAQTDEVDEEELIRTGKKKMTALDRLERMQTLERQGVPYAAQHRMGVPAMQPMPPYPQQPMPQAQPITFPASPQPMQPMMAGTPQPITFPASPQPMQPMMGGPVPMPPYAQQPMPQAQPMPQQQPMPQAQPMPQQQPMPQGNVRGQNGRGFDYSIDNNANFDF